MSMVRVKVEVTARDIAEGVRRECKKCPVAIAMSKALGMPVLIIVPTWRLIDEPVYGYLPLHVVERIREFDMQGLMEPFSFEASYKPSRELPEVLL